MIRCGVSSVALFIALALGEISLVRTASPIAAVCPVNVSLSTIASDKSLTEDEIYTLLNVHNNVRHDVVYASSMPLFEWSGDLAASAYTWLSQCSTSTSPSSSNSIGYNVGTSQTSVQSAVQIWAAQQANFAYNGVCDPTSSYCGTCLGSTSDTVFATSCSMYLQMIWSTTTTMGCAKYTCNGGLWVACLYSPRGLLRKVPPYTLSSTPSTICQYQTAAAAAPGSGMSTTMKVLSGIGSALVVVGGIAAYFFMDGGDCSCCCGGQKRASRQGEVYDASAYAQLNTGEVVVTAVPAGNHSML